MSDTTAPSIADGLWLPWQSLDEVVASGAHADGTTALSQGSLLLTCIDLGVVAAVTSGYFQVYSHASGASFFTGQMTTTETAYASWRGAKFFLEGDYPQIYNNTTSAMGVSMFGFQYRGLVGGALSSNWSLP